MRDESTPTPEAGEHAEQPKQQGSWRPRGKDKKPRKRRSDAPPPRDPADIAAEEEAREEADWAQRGQHWQREADEKPRPPRSYRYRKIERKPLVLVGHGVRLRVHQGTLLVQNGFTHYRRSERSSGCSLEPGDFRRE
jgi:hypothetical protein